MIRIAPAGSKNTASLWLNWMREADAGTAPGAGAAPDKYIRRLRRFTQIIFYLFFSFLSGQIIVLPTEHKK